MDLPHKNIPNPTPLVIINRKNTWKKWILALSGLLLSLIILGSIFLVQSFNKIIVKPNTPKPPAAATATPTPDPDRPFAIALLGYGGGKHDGGALTDSMIVAKISPKLQTIELISVPRDLWVNLPVYEGRDFYSKINSAYVIGLDDRNYKDKKEIYSGAAGGGELSKEVLSDVLGFPIDHFIALDFQGFAKAIDLLGGIDVLVERSFDDYQYPIEGKENDLCEFPPETIAAMEATMSGLKLEQAFTCRYEHLHFDKGIAHMDGATALKYVRSRHSATEGSDYARSARQRNLIIAVKNKIFQIGFLPKIIPSINLLTSHIQTDIDLTQTEKFLSRASEFADYQITNLALTEDNVLKQGKADNGAFILMPKDGIGVYDTIHRFVVDPAILTPAPTTPLSPTTAE